MALRLIDPKGASKPPSSRLAPRIPNLQGLKVALLGNSKVNADVLLRETAKLFETEYGCTVLSLAEKPDSGRPAEPAQLDRLARESDFLITAVGD